MFIYKYLAPVILCGLVLFATSEAKGDTLTFSNLVALENNGDKIDLFGHPIVVLVGSQISFLVDIKGDLALGTTDTLVITYQEVGSAPIVQSYQIPAFGVVPPPYSQLFTITSPMVSPGVVGASLTLNILHTAPDFVIPLGPNAGQQVDSYTYTFNVVQPVPEPASFVLFGSALSACTALLRRRSKTT